MRVEIADPDLCPLYTGCRVSGVKNRALAGVAAEPPASGGPAPDQQRGGITNFVMPSSASAARLRRPNPSGVANRRARSFAEEKVVTLDGKERTLPSGSA